MTSSPWSFHACSAAMRSSESSPRQARCRSGCGVWASHRPDRGGMVMSLTKSPRIRARGRFRGRSLHSIHLGMERKLSDPRSDGNSRPPRGLVTGCDGTRGRGSYSSPRDTAPGEEREFVFQPAPERTTAVATTERGRAGSTARLVSRCNGRRFRVRRPTPASDSDMRWIELLREPLLHP
jgi:hypothetical protein